MEELKTKTLDAAVISSERGGAIAPISQCKPLATQCWQMLEPHEQTEERRLHLAQLIKEGNYSAISNLKYRLEVRIDNSIQYSDYSDHSDRSSHLSYEDHRQTNSTLVYAPHYEIHNHPQKLRFRDSSQHNNGNQILWALTCLVLCFLAVGIANGLALRLEGQQDVRQDQEIQF